MVLYKLYVFCSAMIFKMAATAGLSLTLDPMGKMFQNASSWISNRHKKHIICRGPSNDHSWAVWFQLSEWFQRRSVLKHFPHRVQMVLYKLYVFCSAMIFKMAATAGLSLTLDPMGKMFQNASSLKPLG
jgi:hypothetical protein